MFDNEVENWNPVFAYILTSRQLKSGHYIDVAISFKKYFDIGLYRNQASIERYGSLNGIV